MQTFRELREEHCYYVDKTAYVKRLLDEGKHYFLSRPRRFGKSLFLDTLKEFFEGNEALFAGLHTGLCSRATWRTRLDGRLEHGRHRPGATGTASGWSDGTGRRGAARALMALIPIADSHSRRPPRRVSSWSAPPPALSRRVPSSRNSNASNSRRAPAR